MIKWIFEVKMRWNRPSSPLTSGRQPLLSGPLVSMGTNLLSSLFLLEVKFFCATKGIMTVCEDSYSSIQQTMVSPVRNSD